MKLSSTAPGILGAVHRRGVAVEGVRGDQCERPREGDDTGGDPARRRGDTTQARVACEDGAACSRLGRRRIACHHARKLRRSSPNSAKRSLRARLKALARSPVRYSIAAVSDSPVRDVRLQRRRERERDRRARRRRGQLRLAALLALIAVIVLVIAEGAGGGRSKPPYPTAVNVLVSAHAVSAGGLGAAVQDSAVAAPRAAPYLLGGIDAAGALDRRDRAAARRVQCGWRPSARDPARRAGGSRSAGAIYVFGGGDVASYDHILSYDPASGAVAHAGGLPRPHPTWRSRRSGRPPTSSAATTASAALDTIVAWRPGTRAHDGRAAAVSRCATPRVAAFGRRLPDRRRDERRRDRQRRDLAAMTRRRGRCRRSGCCRRR